MKLNLIYLAILISLTSCNKNFYSTGSVANEIKSFNLEEFDRFTFQLVRKKSTEKHPIFTNSLNKEKNDLIYEELYLYLEKKGNRAIYLTTFSHKYIQKDGVFNNEDYNQKIYANQIDFIFVGNYDKDKIKFKNPKYYDIDEIEFYYTKTGKNIKLDKITNNYGLRKDRKINKYVDMDSVFAVDIIYQEDLRKFVFKQKDDKEFDIKSLTVDLNNLYFELVKNKKAKYRFLKNRTANEISK